jgi:predicted RNase H-like HicB family nuclease
MEHAEYTVIYERALEGGHYAHIPALEITTEGESLEEAQAMARDAMENTLACFRELNLPFPEEVRSEKIGVEA